MTLQRFLDIKKSLPSYVELLVVTKNQSSDAILPFLEAGHRLFGENRVQEAYSKWPNLKERYPECQLHLIGHLQSNKLTQTIKLFDCIQSVHSTKIAHALVDASIPFFIQVNIGNEPQKNGIAPKELNMFIQPFLNNPLLKGLMTIPPKDISPLSYFHEMKNLSDSLGLRELSMGMSDDYTQAIECGSTFIRLGRVLFS